MYFFSTERNAKIHLLAAVFVIIAGFYFAVSALEWCVLMLCVSGVFAFEAMNSGVELVVDKLWKEWNTTAGIIKDVSAAAVTFVSIGAAICGVIIFLPKILAL